MAFKAQLASGIQNAEAVRPHEPHPGAAPIAHELPLPTLALRAYLGESSRDHEHRPDTASRTILRHANDLIGGHDHDGELHRSRDVAQRSVGRKRLDHISAIVDGIDRSRELASDQVVQDLAADRSSPSGGSDDGDGPGGEEASHRGDRRRALALLKAR